MPRQQPHVSQVKNDRQLMAEGSQEAQIEIPTVQIVSMNKVGAARQQPQEVPGARVLKSSRPRRRSTSGQPPAKSRTEAGRRRRTGSLSKGDNSRLTAPTRCPHAADC